MSETSRVLSADDIERFSKLYLTDELTPEDVRDLRRHLSIENWLILQRDRAVMQQSKITSISAGRSEEQIAKEIRDDLQARLEALGEVMTKARREHGFTVAFQFAPPDSFGRVTLAMLEISKKLC